MGLKNIDKAQTVTVIFPYNLLVVKEGIQITNKTIIEEIKILVINDSTYNAEVSLIVNNEFIIVLWFLIFINKLLSMIYKKLT